MGNKAIRAVRECGIAELRRLLDEVLLFFYLIFSLVNLEPKKLCFTWGLFSSTNERGIQVQTDSHPVIHYLSIQLQ